ncbi:dTDP-glucose 4,6-dehydratase-like [Procambarus clarkii]|uniref:dTDP-glucose 4,6-dehydratase-like n=1 Tax=Procambarus clarkii TaxID=6728 RepID=UPI0037422FF3
MTYASNKQFLFDFERHSNFKFIGSDINDLDRLYDCDYVINCCAETHVDNSIASSDIFVKSNINGVHHLLQLIREKGNKMPTLIQFSTDEVYGDIVSGSHTEDDILKPSNPYSATKAAADMLVLAWARTYGVPYIILRPTNNYGTGQYVEKLIPKSVKYLSIGRKIELHDGGNPRRTWLHADDTANAVITVITAGVVNEIYNIAGNFETSNRDVVERIVALVDPGLTISDCTVECSRPGQDVRYSIDDTKLKNLGWTPSAVFQDELIKIVDYYQSNFIW